MGYISPSYSDTTLPSQWFVGIDWGDQVHQVYVLDRTRRCVGEREVHHDGVSLAQFASWLRDLCAGEPAQVAIAIETPHGAIVDMLIERRFQVFALNPKQLARFRERRTVAGAKDDRRDALALADALRTDLPSFRAVHVSTPELFMLRE